jgi:hypothetical protein
MVHLGVELNPRVRLVPHHVLHVAHRHQVILRAQTALHKTAERSAAAIASQQGCQQDHGSVTARMCCSHGTVPSKNPASFPIYATQVGWLGMGIFQLTPFLDLSWFVALMAQ